MSSHRVARGLQIAVRAYAPPRRERRRLRRHLRSDLVLLLDAETMTDAVQRLLFLSYRVYRRGRLMREGLVHADDLGAADLEVLRRYVSDHADDEGGRLWLLSRTEFVNEVLWPVGYRARALIVGFNLPFDLSRLAVVATKARNGGFSLRLWESVDAEGRRWRHRWRPDITIKAYATHRQFIAFTTPARLDPENRVDGKPFRGRFLDLHTATFALTDRLLRLDLAAETFGLETRKLAVAGHGAVTPAYIDYNRHDVRMTWQLCQRVVDELSRHPIDLAPEEAFSPATLTKGYLRTIGIVPPLEREPPVAGDVLGRFMVAYYGGRSEVRIRATPLPVRYVDFTSMYPTSFALQRCWPWMTAASFGTADATPEARRILANASRDSLLDPAAWPALAGVVCRIRPRGALLPVRARYGQDPGSEIGSSAWTIGLNHLESDAEAWYMLTDVLAGKILGGPEPEVIEAIRVAPVGTTGGLQPIRLRGEVQIGVNDDLFRRAIEERHALRQRSEPTADPWIERFLKTFATGAYGIAAEYHQRDPVPGGVKVEAWGLWPIEARVRTPEEPGEFCWPPLAASITAGGRLLLALLEAELAAAGGGSVACDTDSLLIVASQTGGLLACPGGPELLADGRSAIRALSYAAVDEILERLNVLNPFRRDLVPSLVKLEPENFSTGPAGDGDLYAAAVSAKRYVLYRLVDGKPVIIKASSHGLGLYRSPIPNPQDWPKAKRWPAWVEAVWQGILSDFHAAPEKTPDWYGLPALSQLSITSPAVLAPFQALNAGQAYPDQVKPFNFMLVGHVDPLAPLPDGLTAERLVPIAPFASDARSALSMPWRNRLDGRPIRVSTSAPGEPDAVRLRTYGDVVRDYRWHPEHKSGDPRGGVGIRNSRGLLPRLSVLPDGVPIHIGKESNRLEEVEGGAIVAGDDVTAEYRDERQEWDAALPALRRLRAEHGWRQLAEESGLSERALRYALNGGKTPRLEARRRLLRLAFEPEPG